MRLTQIYSEGNASAYDVWFKNNIDSDVWLFAGYIHRNENQNKFNAFGGHHYVRGKKMTSVLVGSHADEKFSARLLEAGLKENWQAGKCLMCSTTTNLPYEA